MKGKFISLEGPEGSGKSTLIKLIDEYFKSNSIPIRITREPGGVDIAEKIRNIILDINHTEMHERTEALLFAAARTQHLVEVVEPNLDKGVTVITDRFIDSSIAYQGVGRGLGINAVLNINLFATAGLLPDLTILLDLPPEVGLERIKTNRSEEVNRIDLESLTFHNKIRDCYLELASGQQDRFVVIDATKDIQEVFEEVKEIILKLLKM